METNIHFNKERFQTLKETYRRWWDGTLDRPILPIVTNGYESKLDPSRYPVMSFETAWDDSIAPEEFVEQQNAALSTVRFHGDAFPSAAPTRFGAGALAALLGCKPISSKHTIWFLPPEKDKPIEDLHFEYNEDTYAFKRIMRYYEAAWEKWHGSVVVNMIDLGGVLDVLASFRGTENLLMDLIDSPEEVLRCANEIQELWFRYFDRFNKAMGPDAPGYSYWYGLYNEKPGYILQSDFCYMISPEMFDTFVGPELESSAKRLFNAVYHMDGIGQIPHLDSLLKIDAIKGYQWQPGDGTPRTMNWDDLHLRILNAGKKLISLSADANGDLPEMYHKYLPQLLLPTRGFHKDDMAKAQAYGAKYGVEV